MYLYRSEIHNATDKEKTLKPSTEGKHQAIVKLQGIEMTLYSQEQHGKVEDNGARQRRQ